MTNTAELPVLHDEQVINVSQSLLPSNDDARLLAAVDCGSALTKIVYATESDDADIKQMHFVQFQNEQLDFALDFLRAKLDNQTTIYAKDRSKKLLRVTGLGVALHEDKIKEKLNVALEYVDEPASHCSGLYFLLKHCPEYAEFCHPTPAIDESEFSGIEHGETFKRIFNAQEAALASSESRFPCLLVVYGSTAKVFRVNEDGSSEATHSLSVAGKSFLGICQLLLGTKDYPEILQLAAAGKRGNVDTQIRDLMQEEKPPVDSPYGHMPPSLPLFGFGKGVDLDLSLEDARREDVAQSLLSSFTSNIVHQVTHAASYDKIRNIFYGGNFFRHEFARGEVIKSSKVFFAIDAMNLQFLKFSSTAALGALLHGSAN